MVEQNKNVASQSSYYAFKCGVSSFLSTCVSGTIVHPLQLIKVRFQSHDGKSNKQNLVPKYKNIFSALKQISTEQGFRGLYKGFSITVLSAALASSLFFSIYENRKRALHISGKQKDSASVLQILRAGIQSGILVSLITQPMWVIKTRMLLNTNQPPSQIHHIRQKIREINSQYGLKGFYKGLSINLVLSLSGAVQMMVYECSKKLYDKLNIPQTGFMEKNFFCGGMAKVGNVLFTYPFTTVRTRIQQNQYLPRHQDAKYHNIKEVVKSTISNEGIKGFYKGLSANILRGIPERAIYFYLYQIIKKILINPSSIQN